MKFWPQINSNIVISFRRIPSIIKVADCYSLQHGSAQLYRSSRSNQILYHNHYKSNRHYQTQRISSNMILQTSKYFNCTTPLASPKFPSYPRNHMSQHPRSILSFSNNSWSTFDICRYYARGCIHIVPNVSQHGGVTYHARRSVGRSSHRQDGDLNNNNNVINVAATRIRLQDRTKSALKGRMSRLQTSILHHKARLRDKIVIHRNRGALAVGTLRKQFGVKKENVKTIPNLLTTLRMASAPLLAYLVVNESFGLACGIFVVAGITDVLDGYIARNFKNQTTALGTALDPLADKLLISFLTVSLTSVNLIPVPVTVLILSRDVGLIAASFYIRYMSLAPPRTLSRYFDVSHVTARLHPSKISKLNTLLQLSFVASTLASPVLDCVGHPLLQALMYLTATTTFLSGADYVLTWRRRLEIIKNK